MRNIDDIRKDINEVDEKIIDLLNKRFDLSREVKIYKIKNQMDIFDKKREDKILKKIEKNNKEYGSYLKKIYQSIMDESKNLQKNKYGLLGKKLTHSFSKEIHEKIGNYTYEYFEKDEKDLDDFFEKRDFKAINVTIPYKKTVIKYLDEISDKAKRIGAVNTIVNDKSKLIGFNTDYEGFLYNLKKNKISVKGKNVLILGKGATSETVKVVLEDLSAKNIVRLSRRFKPYFKDIKNYKDYEIIINTTPVGMFPNNEESLEDVNFNDFKNIEAFVDVIYNPLMTKLAIDSKIKKISYATGIRMLIAQAFKAVEIFKNVKLDDELIENVRRDIYKSQMNIALIGMPGAGKTTIGSLLSKKLKRDFFDIDKEFVKKYGDIEYFFKKYGEDKFRQKESEILKEICKKNGVIIACGGGVVKKDINYYYLKGNSLIINIKRDLDKLDIKNRPLSKNGDIKKLFDERKVLYKKFQDFSIINENIRESVDEIIRIFYESIGS